MVHKFKKGEILPGIGFSDLDASTDADDAIVGVTGGAIPDFLDKAFGFEKREEEEDEQS